MGVGARLWSVNNPNYRATYVLRIRLVMYQIYT